jgi:hypothetical protein
VEPGRDPVDPLAVAWDDTLLDGIVLGTAVPGDDEVAALLAAWRADLLLSDRPGDRH